MVKIFLIKGGIFYLIILKNIAKIYNRETEAILALSNVNLHIKKGGFTSIIGCSGSGKTTLMNILGCLDSPTSGKYLLDGEIVSDLPFANLAKIRNKQIGFVFQGFNLVPKLSAIENVELPLMFRGMCLEERRKLSKDALSKVGLFDRIHHRPSELSGGQQQRVAIARAIVTSPNVILADEPTGNLDSISASSIMDILTSLHLEGTTIVLITHDEKIAKYAQNIISIEKGQIKEI